MTIYNNASFYDCLYKDKDYDAECDFLKIIFNRYATTSVERILDLGCGTGGHAIILDQRGYSVVGLDRSKEMLDLAQSKAGKTTITFHQCDIRDISLEETFDVVISMFAVMGYMTTNEDFHRAFRTARNHLELGGLFVFDNWFGPAVFHEPPTFRQKELIYNGKRVIRIATPAFDPIEQVANIRYDIFEMLHDQKINEVTEHHYMRPLFVQEVRQFAELNCMKLLTVFPWMDIDRKIELTQWRVCFVLRAT